MFFLSKKPEKITPKKPPSSSLKPADEYGEGDPLTAAVVAGSMGGNPLTAALGAEITGSTGIGIGLGILDDDDDLF